MGRGDRGQRSIGGPLAPSSQDDRKGFSLRRRLAASVIQLRCTLSSHCDAIPPRLSEVSRRVSPRYTARSRRIPKDNPDTRFPITTLRNDTSAQHHRSSFIDFVRRWCLSMRASSSAPSIAARFHALIATLLANISDVLDVCRYGFSSMSRGTRRKAAIFANIKFRLLPIWSS